ncbi:MAG: Uma2 family endonuclease [Bacteroidia bacterium]
MSNHISFGDLPHYTVEDYKKWEGNWELIHGIPYAMSPSPRLTHQRVSRKIMVLLDRHFEICSHCEVLQPIDIHLEKDTVVQPDVSVICGSTDSVNEYNKPVLVVEILSPSTAIKDRNLKFRLYESNGIKYYWLVEPDQKWVEVYELIDGKYARLEVSGSVTFDLGECVFDFDFREIF